MNRMAVIASWLAGGIVWAAAMTGLSALGEPAPVEPLIAELENRATVPPSRSELRLVEAGLIAPREAAEPAVPAATTLPRGPMI